MASVRKREWKGSDGKPCEAWVVEYTDANGKRRRVTPKTGLFKDAERLKRKIEREIEDGVHTAASDSLTVREGMELWIRDCARRRQLGDLAGTTVANYDYRMRKHIAPALGGRKVSEINHIVLNECFEKLGGRLAPSTIAGLLATFKAFLNFMVRKGFVKRNVMRDDPLKVSGKKKQRVTVPTKAEIADILNALERRGDSERYLAFNNRRAIFYMGLLCGMRRGEMVALHWRNVDFAAGVIRVENGFTAHDGLKAPKTTAGLRELPMPDAVRDALLSLLAYRQLRDRMALESGSRDAVWQRHRDEFESPPAADLTASVPDGFVLISRKGTNLTPTEASSTYVLPVLKKAGLSTQARSRHTLHTLRHAYISLLIEDGLSAMHLMRLAGHRSVRVTYDIYGHLFPNDGVERASVNRVAAHLNTPKISHGDLSI